LEKRSSVAPIAGEIKKENINQPAVDTRNQPFSISAPQPSNDFSKSLNELLLMSRSRRIAIAADEAINKPSLGPDAALSAASARTAG
jgi:hypothetical protein